MLVCVLHLMSRTCKTVFSKKKKKSQGEMAFPRGQSPELPWTHPGEQPGKRTPGSVTGLRGTGPQGRGRGDPVQSVPDQSPTPGT